MRAFKNGDFNTVVRILHGVDDGPELHLCGLALRRLGQLDAALAMLDRAAKKLPADAEVARNLGLAARSIGQADKALAAFKKATQLAPRFAAAWQSRGRAELDLERFAAAERAFSTALEIEPESAASVYGMACVLVETGRSKEAQSLLMRLRRRGRDDASIAFMLGRCALDSGDVDAALIYLRDAHDTEPGELSLRILAEALWMSGDTAGFEKHVFATARQAPAFAALAADLLRQSDQPDRALALLDEIAIDTADVQAVRSLICVDSGSAHDAEVAARRAIAAAPMHRAARAGLYSALLMQGRAIDALPLIRRSRKAEPLDQNWLAFEATALRACDPDAYRALLDDGRLVREFTLPVPAGFANIEAFNQALLAALDAARPYQKRPLAQSLRGGNQTQNDLLHMESPAVKSYLKALRQPVAMYLDELTVPATHPVATRYAGNFRIAECWSVELQPGGFHVNHVHPRGWLSSAYYVDVPPTSSEEREQRAGWIQFGKPPFPVVPPLDADMWIEPKAGSVVLFPSFVWHGTNPFTAGARRVTAPFDVLPG